MTNYIAHQIFLFNEILFKLEDKKNKKEYGFQIDINKYQKGLGIFIDLCASHIAGKDFFLLFEIDEIGTFKKLDL